MRNAEKLSSSYYEEQCDSIFSTGHIIFGVLFVYFQISLQKVIENT